MYLARHGQTMFNVVFGETKQDPGIEDPPLTELGFEQAAELAERFVALDIRRIISSPYTRALQRSIPSMQPKGTELYTIKGLPPDLSKPLAGCSFAARCEFATDRCRAEAPALAAVKPGHAHACLRVQAGEL